MIVMAIFTSVVVPARQRLTRSVPAPVFSALVIATPIALRLSLVKSGTVPVLPAIAPRITSSTASTALPGVLATVIRICRLRSVLRPITAEFA